MTLGITKYDNLRQIGHALNALLTSIPEVGELLRQFLIQDIQNGWSHSDSNPNFRSAAVGFERTRSRQTLHSISWLCFNASKCFCFFSHDFICSSLSSGLKGCKQCFPHVGHKSPCKWGHFSPRGQLPAAANEQMGRSDGLILLASPISQSSRESWCPYSWFQAGLVGGMKGLLEADSSIGLPGTGVRPPNTDLVLLPGGTISKMRDWHAFVDEDEAEEWLREALTCSYLQRLPYAQSPFW